MPLDPRDEALLTAAMASGPCAVCKGTGRPRPSATVGFLTRSCPGCDGSGEAGSLARGEVGKRSRVLVFDLWREVLTLRAELVMVRGETPANDGAREAG